MMLPLDQPAPAPKIDPKKSRMRFYLPDMCAAFVVGLVLGALELFMVLGFFGVFAG